MKKKEIQMPLIRMSLIHQNTKIKKREREMVQTRPSVFLFFFHAPFWIAAVARQHCFGWQLSSHATLHGFTTAQAGWWKVRKQHTAGRQGPLHLKLPLTACHTFSAITCLKSPSGTRALYHLLISSKLAGLLSMQERHNKKILRGVHKHWAHLSTRAKSCLIKPPTFSSPFSSI